MSELSALDGIDAFGLAVEAHAGQRYGDRPYIEHLRDVAMIAADAGLPASVVLAAWLHDALEDTSLAPDRIREVCGDEVLYLVQAVTDEPGANRKERKAKTLKKTREAGPDAVALKLCDRIANLKRCVDERSPRCVRYIEEDAEFRTLRTDGQNEDLWARYERLVERARVAGGGR